MVLRPYEMKRLRIWFPLAELDLVKDAVTRFNDTHGYLDELIINTFKDHQVLLVPAAESAMFVESYLDAFSLFSKQRIRQDLIKELTRLLEQEPWNIPANHSLKFLKGLSF